MHSHHRTGARAARRTIGGETLAALRRTILFVAGAAAILVALALGGLDLPGERPVADSLIARLVGTTLAGADERVILRALVPTP